MIDHDFVEKRLAFIEDVVEDLRRNARTDLLETDRRERYYVERSLQLAAQAALDIGWHIHAHERKGEPESNQQVFQRMGRIGWLPEELADRLARMAGFRNVVVHAYLDVDPGVVRRAVTEGLDDLEAYVDAIRERIDVG